MILTYKYVSVRCKEYIFLYIIIIYNYETVTRRRSARNCPSFLLYRKTPMTIIILYNNLDSPLSGTPDINRNMMVVYELFTYYT